MQNFTVNGVSVSIPDGAAISESVITPEAPSAKLTRLGFINRFTDEEAITIDLASMGETVEAATIRRFMSKVNAATYIDISRQDTISGVGALEQIGLIGEGRAAEILSPPVDEDERWNGSL